MKLRFYIVSTTFNLSDLPVLDHVGRGKVGVSLLLDSADAKVFFGKDHRMGIDITMVISLSLFGFFNGQHFSIKNK